MILVMCQHMGNLVLSNVKCHETAPLTEPVQSELSLACPAPTRSISTGALVTKGTTNSYSHRCNGRVHSRFTAASSHISQISSHSIPPVVSQIRHLALIRRLNHLADKHPPSPAHQELRNVQL